MMVAITPPQIPNLVNDLVPTLSAVGGALWALYMYLDHQRETQREATRQADTAAITRRIEAQRPFLEKQLALYVETAQVAGKLVTSTDFQSEDWKRNCRRFEELYWTELSMVEYEGVKKAMEAFATKLRWMNQHLRYTGDDIGELQQLSYHLARALRSGIEATWDVDLSSGTTK